MSGFLRTPKICATLLVCLSLQTQAYSSSTPDSLTSHERKLRQGYYVQILVYRELLKHVKVEDGPVFLSVKSWNPELLVFERIEPKGFVHRIGQLDIYRTGRKRGVELRIEGLRWINDRRVVVMALSKVNPNSKSDYDPAEHGNRPQWRIIREGAFARKAFQLHRRGNRWHIVKVRTLVTGG